MKPVDQRYWQPECREVGDCLAACVASIFELDLDEVPHFMKLAAREPEGNWLAMLNAWAWDFGLGANYITYHRRRYTYRQRPLNWHPGYWIGVVRSRSSDPRITDSHAHAVVMHVDEVVHDPNEESRSHPEPYRFGGEVWFEVADPKAFYDSVDWRRVVLSGRLAS